jgi:hypothetical protein
VIHVVESNLGVIVADKNVWTMKHGNFNDVNLQEMPTLLGKL